MTQVAVISGKGGTGKSSISAAFATLDSKVVIADCDVDAAKLYLLFNPVHEDESVYIGGHKAVINYDTCTGCGICADYCRFDAISVRNGRIVIYSTSCDGCFLCSRICPSNSIKMIQNDRSRMYSGSFRNGKMVYGRIAPGEENSGKLVTMIREKAKLVARENDLKIIILDGPPGIGCPVISTITGVDKIVIVTEPTISGLHDLQRAFEVVKKSGTQAYVIINKFDLNKDMSLKIDEWCNNSGLKVTGHLPFEPDVVNAMVKGLSIIELNAESVISRMIAAIWTKYLKPK